MSGRAPGPRPYARIQPKPGKPGRRAGSAIHSLPAEYDEDTGAPVRLNGRYVRDEAGQAAYLSEVLEVLASEGVDSAFVFLFALAGFPHRPDGDPGTTWTWPAPASSGTPRAGAPPPTRAPKDAFTAVAECYQACPATRGAARRMLGRWLR
jgi:hypothetical protein